MPFCHACCIKYMKSDPCSDKLVEVDWVRHKEGRLNPTQSLRIAQHNPQSQLSAEHQHEQFIKEDEDSGFSPFFSSSYLGECPGELHVLGSCIAALQEPGSAVHIYQTLVVVIVDGWTQHTQMKLLGAGVVHVLLGERRRKNWVQFKKYICRWKLKAWEL